MKSIPEHYKVYTDYSNKDQMLPRLTDGLKPVQRRVLLTMYLVAKAYVKTVKVIGEMIARFHPHADSGGPCIWAVNNKFADGDGQWGSHIGVENIEPAAARYTKLKINNDVLNMAFKYIDSVKFEESELDPEPKLLPTMLPFCLWGSEECIGIGTGFKTNIPIYDKQDLFKRLSYLLDTTKKQVIIKPKLYNCDIISKNKDLNELLTTGEVKLTISGKYKEDVINKRIYIHGWSPRSTFQSILNKIDKYNDYNLLSNEMISFIDESTEKTGTNIRFEVAKQRNTDDIYGKMKEAIENSLIANISYSMYVVDDNDNIRIASVDEMLLAAHTNYTKAFKTHYENRIVRIDQIVQMYNYIEQLKPHLSDSLKLKDDAKIIKYLSKQTNVPEKNISEIFEKYKIKKLLTVSLDTQKILNEKKDIYKILSNLKQSVLDEYKELIG